MGKRGGMWSTVFDIESGGKKYKPVLDLVQLHSK